MPLGLLVVMALSMSVRVVLEQKWDLSAGQSYNKECREHYVAPRLVGVVWQLLVVGLRRSGVVGLAHLPSLLRLRVGHRESSEVWKAKQRRYAPDLLDHLTALVHRALLVAPALPLVQPHRAPFRVLVLLHLLPSVLQPVGVALTAPRKGQAERFPAVLQHQSTAVLILEPPVVLGPVVSRSVPLIVALQLLRPWGSWLASAVAWRVPA